MDFSSFEAKYKEAYENHKSPEMEQYDFLDLSGWSNVEVPQDVRQQFYRAELNPNPYHSVASELRFDQNNVVAGMKRKAAHVPDLTDYADSHVLNAPVAADQPQQTVIPPPAKLFAVDEDVQDDILHSNGCYKDFSYPVNSLTTNESPERMDDEENWSPEQGFNTTVGSSVLPSSSSMQSQPGSLFPRVGVKRKHPESLLSSNDETCESAIDVDDGSTRQAKLFKFDHIVETGTVDCVTNVIIDDSKKLYISPEVQKSLMIGSVCPPGVDYLVRDKNNPLERLIKNELHSRQMALVPWVPSGPTVTSQVPVMAHTVTVPEESRTPVQPSGTGLTMIRPSTCHNESESEDECLECS